MNESAPGRTIETVWAERGQRVALWLARWRASWPADGPARTLEPDAERLEYVIADLSDGSVAADLQHTLANVAPGGSRPAAAFINECLRRRSDSWRTAARGAWLLDLLCPDCESRALQLTIAASRPRICCLECGRSRAVARAQL